MDRETLLRNCKALLSAYQDGAMGACVMPEDSNPGFSNEEKEMRLAYFSLPMSLNYQRDSYKLWETALKTYRDPETRFVFDVTKIAEVSNETLQKSLLKHRLALQPNKHIQTWKTISQTVLDNWESFTQLIHANENDFLKLQQTIQLDHKKGFPYLSGPKIFHYWSFILKEYGNVPLKNAEFIDIAPDTHILKCSVKLGVISEAESQSLSRERISERWRNVLRGSGINPIDMHPSLWFWSRGGFEYSL